MIKEREHDANATTSCSLCCDATVLATAPPCWPAYIKCYENFTRKFQSNLVMHSAIIVKQNDNGISISLNKKNLYILHHVQITLRRVKLKLKFKAKKKVCQLEPHFGLKTRVLGLFDSAQVFLSNFISHSKFLQGGCFVFITNTYWSVPLFKWVFRLNKYTLTSEMDRLAKLNLCWSLLTWSLENKSPCWLNVKLLDFH